MSTTLAQSLIEAQEQLATAAAAMACVCEERDALKVALESSAAELKDARAGRIADAAAHKAAQEDAVGKLTAEQAAHAETQKALAEARTKLADPAYQMAGPGSKTPVPEGGQLPDNPPKTREQLEADYRAIDGSTIEGARARAAFREKHKDQLGL